MKYKDVTLLFLTCDKYQYLWDGFFTLFKKNFPDFDGQIQSNVVGDRIICGYEVKGIKYCKDDSWGTRTRSAAKKIKTELLFLMLDDFFIYNFSVYNFDFGIKTISSNKKVGVLTLFDYNTRLNLNSLTKYNSDYFVKPNLSDYYANLQPALWRKSYFLKVVRRGETAWDFESYGTFRAWHYNRLHLYPINHGKNNIDIDDGGIQVRGVINDITIEKLSSNGIYLVIPDKNSSSLPEYTKNRSAFYKKHYLRFSLYLPFLRK